MPERSATDALFAQLMALNHEAFDAGYYSTAYHTLAAALHVAYAHHTKMPKALSRWSISQGSN
jgi:hypothetical protein